jgi:hypothetical protein
MMLRLFMSGLQDKQKHKAVSVRLLSLTAKYWRCLCCLLWLLHQVLLQAA